MSISQSGITSIFVYSHEINALTEKIYLFHLSARLGFELILKVKDFSNIRI